VCRAEKEKKVYKEKKKVLGEGKTAFLFSETDCQQFARADFTTHFEPDNQIMKILWILDIQAVKWPTVFSFFNFSVNYSKENE
ncbi:MAG: hypothetical protein C0180_00330, partial [Aciduliprofundum sp.]